MGTYTVRYGNNKSYAAESYEDAIRFTESHRGYGCYIVRSA